MEGGETHERMKKALPRAAYIAFTGTPLLKDEKTSNKFGPIVHAYTMQRAVEDETLSRTSMDDARARIRRLKEKYLLPYRDPDPRAARAAAGAGERAALSRDIMDRAGMTA